MLSVASTQQGRARTVLLTVIAAWLAFPQWALAQTLAVFDRAPHRFSRTFSRGSRPLPSFSSWWRGASPWRGVPLGAGSSASSSVFRLPLARRKLSPGSVGCSALDGGAHMRHRNAGLIADPLFIGATRPSMLWGVTYSAVMLNAMCIMELFLLTKNLLDPAPGGADTRRLHAAYAPAMRVFLISCSYGDERGSPRFSPTFGSGRRVAIAPSSLICPTSGVFGGAVSQSVASRLPIQGAASPRYFWPHRTAREA